MDIPEDVDEQEVATASLDVEHLFGRDGPPRLVLVTCGGNFDRAARSYEANVVVGAEPVDGGDLPG